MWAPATSSAERELDLVSKVDLMIVNAAQASPDRLQSTLQRYLPALLLKGASPHYDVRQLVLTAVQRVHTFLKANPGINLPLQALLLQYKDCPYAAVRHLDLSFLSAHVPLLSADKKRLLFPHVTKDLKKHATPELFNLFLYLLAQQSFPLELPSPSTDDAQSPGDESKDKSQGGSQESSPVDTSLRDYLGLTDEDVDYLWHAFRTLLFLRFSAAPSANIPEVDPAQAHGYTPLTWTFLDPERASFHKVYAQIRLLRKAILALLQTNLFTPRQRFTPYLYGKLSTDRVIAEECTLALRRLPQEVLEDETLVRQVLSELSYVQPVIRTQTYETLSASRLAASLPEYLVIGYDALAKQQRLQQQQQQQQSEEQVPAHATTQEEERAFLKYLNWCYKMRPVDANYSVVTAKFQEILDAFHSVTLNAADQANAGDISPFAMEILSVMVLGDLTDAHVVRLIVSLTRMLATKGLDARFAELAEVTFSRLVDRFRQIEEDVHQPLALPSSSGPSPTIDTVRSALVYLAMESSKRTPTISNTASSNPAVSHNPGAKWGHQFLRFYDPAFHIVNLAALAPTTVEKTTREAGLHGFDAANFTSQPNFHLPDWRNLLSALVPLLYPGLDSTIRNGENVSLGAYKQGVYRDGYPALFAFLFRVLLMEALPGRVEVQTGWEAQVENIFQTDRQARIQLQQHLEQTIAVDIQGQACLHLFLQSCLFALEDDRSESDYLPFLHILSDLTPLLPASMPASPLTIPHDGARFWALLDTHHRDLQIHLAKAISAVLTAPPVLDFVYLQSVQNHLATLISASSSPSSAPGSVHANLQKASSQGALLVYSYLIAQAKLRGVDLGYDESVAPAWTALLQYDIQKAKPVHDVLPVLLEALSILWTVGSGLPTSNAHLDDPSSSSDSRFEGMVAKLTSLAQQGNEKAILALGRLSLHLPRAQYDSTEADARTAEEMDVDKDDSGIGRILDSLFSLHENRQVDVQFAVGEAVATLVGRWDSDCVQISVRSGPKYEAGAFVQPAQARLVQATLTRILQDCKTTKPSLLKASGIWLFSLVKFCSRLSPIHQRLREIQAAFMRLVSSRDDVVQETASRGLLVVYEKGGAELQKQLANDLALMFTGKGAQIKVEGETQLFDEGALPTGQGESVTSYQDIVSLASEVGDQSLVYKFMSLAANASMWSTRSAFGRFGLSSILMESDVDPRLYPKLYRYRFDPNPNVQRSMDDIWRALVKDPRRILSENVDRFLEELLQSALAREWRVREASCGAIGSLLQSQPFASYESWYTQVWEVAVKVLDDVKGSVREAAFRLCRVLSNLLLKNLDQDTESASTRTMVTQTMKFLMSDKGTNSTVQDVQYLALSTILDIVKKGGKASAPFIPELVPHLLGLLSTLEPEGIGYAYQRVKHDVRDMVDKYRLDMANKSPVAEAIDNALRFATAPILQELVPRLEATIQSAMGIPTKIGCGVVVSTLFQNHGLDMQPISSKLMRLLEKQVLDGNDEVSKSYARAAAYGLRVVPEKVRIHYTDAMKQTYFSAEEEGRRQKVGDAVLFIAKRAPDSFTAMEGILLPFVFLGSHDVDQYVQTTMKEAWEQHAGSSRTVVRYVKEVVELAQLAMASPRWDFHHTAAFTVTALAGALTSVAKQESGAVAESNVNLVWPVLEACLALKTFPGKEKVIAVMPSWTGHVPEAWFAQVHAQVDKIMVREAKRQNADYRPHAIRALGEYGKQKATGQSTTKELVVLSKTVLAKYKDREDKDGKDKDKERSAREAVQACLEALSTGYSRERMVREAPVVVKEVLEAVRQCDDTENGGRILEDAEYIGIRRSTWYELVQKLLEDAASQPISEPSTDHQHDDDDVLAMVSKSLDVGGTAGEGQAVERDRLARAKAVAAVVRAQRVGVLRPGPEAWAAFRSQIQVLRDQERSDSVKAFLKD